MLRPHRLTSPHPLVLSVRLYGQVCEVNDKGVGVLFVPVVASVGLAAGALGRSR